MPALLTLHSENSALPAEGVMGLLSQLRIAPKGLPLMLRVTKAVASVALRPALSWTVTTGSVSKAMPPVEFDGELVKVSFVAGPATVNEEVTALVSEDTVAVSV
ncbi:hypothetical protein CVS29_01280 [Arthrobacter psychrochitiniphilus]|uniref:Uncharacterized protein n=1 Tax=Arthrobacter psychrochitiniphilus TaxID=291045 RepID=A0A2V3DXH8_9MICC|nr:hypothetical protein CVS29_01280 [Arthrobacter psychrochitiniphilus]